MAPQGKFDRPFAAPPRDDLTLQLVSRVSRVETQLENLTEAVRSNDENQDKMRAELHNLTGAVEDLTLADAARKDRADEKRKFLFKVVSGVLVALLVSLGGIFFAHFGWRL